MSAPFFDTNIVIDWLMRKAPAITELARYRAHRISRIVWTEVLAGELLDDRDALRQALTNFEVVELDARIALAAAELHFRSRMSLLDAYVLSTAQVNGSILITRNTQVFPAALPGIRVPYNI